jgi:thioredoxin-related protein
MIEKSYESAHQKVLKSDKILMVYLTKKRCKYCNEELAKIVQNHTLSSLIDKHAIFVIVYQKQKDSYPIEMLFATEYPTLFFLDQNELFICKALRGSIKLKDIELCIK